MLASVAQRVELSKGKGKGHVKGSCGKDDDKGKKIHGKDNDTTSGKGDSHGRAMLRELPNEVCSVINRAHMFLRLRITLENAWMVEKKYSHE